MPIKHILTKSLYVVIMIFISGIFIIVLSNNLYKATVYETVSNNLYKKDTSHFVQIDNVELEDLILISGNTFIGKELSDTMRGIYFSSKYNYHLPTIEGRFFNYNDFKVENNYVVIGRALKDYVYKKNNTNYYLFNDIEYEVIGILGIDVESMLDYFVFFNLQNIYNYAPQKTNISFGSNSEELMNTMEHLNLLEYFYEIKLPNNGISRIWKFSNIYIFILICVFLCIITSTLFMILLKTNYYVRCINIFNILGFTKQYTYKNILLSELCIYIFTLFTGVILSFVLNFNNYFVNYIFIGWMLFISLLTCLTFISFTYFLFNLQYNKLISSGDE